SATYTAHPKPPALPTRRSSDLEHQGHDEVRDPREGRDDEEEDHQRRVHRHEAVERLRVEELEAWFRELCPEEHRHEPGLQFLDSDRKSTRLNSSHQIIPYALFC